MRTKLSAAIMRRTISAKAFIFALGQWILIWSFWRLVTLRTQILQNDPELSVRYSLLLVISGTLALGYAVVCYQFLVGALNAGTLRAVLQRSRRMYLLGWFTPALLWALALGLYVLATPFAASLVDGPLLVLAPSGLAALLFLLRGEQPEGDELQTGIEQDDVDWFAIHAGGRASRRPTIVAIALISLLVLVVFRDGLFDSDKIVFGHDLFALHYPFEAYVREALYAGHLPLWNPYLFSGSPALAHPQHLVFYPPQLLLRLLPLNLSFSWGFALHVWLAGVGMFLLCRRLHLASWIALLCAVAYMLNSGLMLRVLAGHAWLLYALAWFPLAWLLFERALNTGRTGVMLGATFTLALIILTGHPTFPLYLLMFLTAFTLYLARARLKDTGSWSALVPLAIRFGVIMLGAVGLSAIQLVPTAVLSGQVSLGSGYDVNAANWMALTMTDLTAFLIPHLYLDLLKLGQAWDIVPYTGILFMLLLPLLLFSRRRRPFFNFLAAMSVIALTVAFGTSLGLFNLLYKFFPPFRVARVPPRALVMLIPAVIVLGGFALQTVQRRNLDEGWLKRFTYGYFMLGLFVMAVAAAPLLVQRSGLLAQWLDPKQSAITGFVAVFALLCTPLIGASHPRSLERKMLVRLLLPAVVIVSGFLAGIFIVPSELFQLPPLVLLATLIVSNVLLLTFFYRYGPSPMNIVLLFALLALDLGSASIRHVSARFPPEFNQDGRLLLRDAPLDELDRVLSYNDQANHYMLGHVGHIDGWNSGILNGYNTFLRTMTRKLAIYTTSIVSNESTVDERALDFLGVRYVIRAGEVGSKQFAPPANRNQFYLYANPDSLPRAFMVYEAEVAQADAAKQLLLDDRFDFATSVVLAEPPPLTLGATGEADVVAEAGVPYHGELNISVQTSAPGILVLSEPYYSERKLFVDGEEAEVLQANLGFMAVALAAGEHQVEVRYVPRSLYVGAGITLLTLLLGLAALLYAHRRQMQARN